MYKKLQLLHPLMSRICKLWTDVKRDFRIWVKITSPVKDGIWITAFAGMTIGGASPTLQIWITAPLQSRLCIEYIGQLVGQAPPYKSVDRCQARFSDLGENYLAGEGRYLDYRYPLSRAQASRE